MREVPWLLLYFACALAIGVAASLLLARRLKRTTFGLELDEIAALVQEREAMLHGIREGVITLDRQGRVTLINDPARRLISLGTTALGSPIGELVPAGRLRDLLTGALPGDDRVVVTDEHILVVNRMPVSRSGKDLGAVVTLHGTAPSSRRCCASSTAWTRLTDAMRAQQREFANRMHTVAGLIELGDHVAAVRFALDVSGQSAGLAEVIRGRVERPEIAAMLVAKTTIAAERGVELVLSDDSRLAEIGADTIMVLTIAGNLIDNAIDAAAAGRRPARVTVRLTAGEGNIVIEVTDSGPGVPEELSSQIFADGFTTKTGAARRHHGIGLALVHRLVHQAGGTITVELRGR